MLRTSPTPPRKTPSSLLESSTVWVVLILLTLSLAACGDDAPSVTTEETTPATTTPTTTSTSSSSTETCEEGQINCACLDGVCEEGRCADGECVACPEGTLRCACGPNDTCGDGLTCADDLCIEEEPCPPGSESCPCDSDGACEEDLECIDNSCIPKPECPEGTLDCPCDGDGVCSDELVCINDLCRDCPTDQAGCPCVDDACEGGLVCAEGACREATGCADAACSPFQLCQESTAGVDAICLEECEEGHTWNAEEERCDEVPPTPNCAANDAPGSILAECQTANRQCLENDEDDATCGDCLLGFLEDGDTCIEDLRANCSEDPNDSNSILAECAANNRTCAAQDEGATCGTCAEGFLEDPNTSQCRSIDDFGTCEANEECPEGLFCGALEPAVASRCLPPPCEEGQSFNLQTQTCNDSCDCTGEGNTGAPWPVTDWNGDCVCETLEGYFFNTASGSRQAESCDGDNDGWTRRSAFVHINEDDESVRLNARCDLRTIEGVTLINEWGQSLNLNMLTLSNGLRPFEELYETDESDEEEEALERQSVAYGQRKFHAFELNPLTKACVSTLDDFNDNGVSDLREHHNSEAGIQREWMQSLMGATYFVELHRGYYAPPADGATHGRYIIEERSRCDAGFALGYDTDEGSYATSCSRRRDQNYDAAEPVGYDFQRWSCDTPDGACPVPGPPVADTSIDIIPPHGLCEERTDEDPVAWRGMGHSSQFKCTEIVNDLEPDVDAFQLKREQLRTTVNDEARFNLNVCGLSLCEDDDPECNEFDREEPQNPAQAIVTCETEVETTTAVPEDLIGQVGWVSLRFRDYGNVRDYAGGCINEQTDWPQLCPGFDPNIPFATVGQGNPNNFGRLSCGCGLNYGGTSCDVGCPTEQLNIGGTNTSESGFCENGYCATIPTEDGQDGGRSGFWMCADFSSTSYTTTLPEVGEAFQSEGTLQVGEDVLDGNITVRGKIPTFGTDGTPMCQNTDDEGRCIPGGFTVR